MKKRLMANLRGDDDPKNAVSVPKEKADEYVFTPELTTVLRRHVDGRQLTIALAGRASSVWIQFA